MLHANALAIRKLKKEFALERNFLNFLLDSQTKAHKSKSASLARRENVLRIAEDRARSELFRLKALETKLERERRTAASDARWATRPRIAPAKRTRAASAAMDGGMMPGADMTDDLPGYRPGR